jgi:hypothetical protein
VEGDADAVAQSLARFFGERGREKSLEPTFPVFRRLSGSLGGRRFHRTRIRLTKQNSRLFFSPVAGIGATI